MQLIAHRGLTNEYIKENTLEAFINALENNYDGIELDIRLTKDKKIVVLHDKLINRTSDGKGNINNLTYNEVLKYNFGTKKKKAKIPLLSTILENIHNKTIIIELKEKIELIELEEVLNKNKSNNYYLCSFNKSYIDNLKGSRYKLGLINYIFNSKINLEDYNFLLILESLFNENIYEFLKNKEIESIIYGIKNNISLKNKEILNEIKYIV